MNVIFFVGLINLFFVPMLPLYAYYRKREQSLKPSLELLFQYGAAAALLIPIAKVLCFLPARLLHLSIPVDSSYYTLAALIAAWLLPGLDRLFRNISIKIDIKEYNGEAEEKLEKNEASLTKAE